MMDEEMDGRRVEMDEEWMRNGWVEMDEDEEWMGDG